MTSDSIEIVGGACIQHVSAKVIDPIEMCDHVKAERCSCPVPRTIHQSLTLKALHDSLDVTSILAHHLSDLAYRHRITM